MGPMGDDKDSNDDPDLSTFACQACKTVFKGPRPRECTLPGYPPDTRDDSAKRINMLRSGVGVAPQNIPPHLELRKLWGPEGLIAPARNATEGLLSSLTANEGQPSALIRSILAEVSPPRPVVTPAMRATLSTTSRRTIKRTYRHDKAIRKLLLFERARQRQSESMTKLATDRFLREQAQATRTVDRSSYRRPLVVGMLSVGAIVVVIMGILLAPASTRRVRVDQISELVAIAAAATAAMSGAIALACELFSFRRDLVGESTRDPTHADWSRTGPDLRYGRRLAGWTMLGSACLVAVALGVGALAGV
jgi:hypothetical protein